MKPKEHMEQVMLESAKIEAMTHTEGWSIIRSYLDNTIKLSHDAWLYADPKSATLEKLRTDARTAHAMINLVENFKEEGKRLWQLWARSEGLIPSTVLDMDNESPNLDEKES